MNKICEWCKCEFETKHGETRFCSHECATMAHRKHCFLKREAWAKELGVTIEEVESMTRRGLIKYALEAKKQGISIEEATRRERAARYAKTKALASAAGMGVKEYRKLYGMARKRRDPNRRPKTYAEIKRENRARKVASGWRGAPVMGGGSIHHNDPYLMPSEYVRC